MSYNVHWYRLPKGERKERVYTPKEKMMMEEHYSVPSHYYEWKSPFDYESMGLNTTCNLRKMFDWAMGLRDWKIIDGMKGRDAFKFVDDAIKKMEAHPQEARRYDAPNGFGTYSDALIFLRDLRAECVYYRDFYLEIL